MNQSRISDLIQVVCGQQLNNHSPDIETAYLELINHGEVAIEPVYTALQTAELESRHTLASILCDILVEVGDNDAFNLLQQLVDSNDNALFSPAIRALARFQHSQIDVILCNLLDHPAPQVRRVVAWQLGRNRAAMAFMPLLSHLRESDVETLRGIIWSLGRLGNSNAIPAIQPFVYHKQEDIAFIAREALQRIQSMTIA